MTPYSESYRARALFNLGRPAKAMADLLSAIKKNPGSSSLHKLKGDILTAHGNFADAIKDYDRAIELGARDAAAYNNRGVALANVGRTREAMEDIGRAMEIVESPPSTTRPPGISGTPW